MSTCLGEANRVESGPGHPGQLAAQRFGQQLIRAGLNHQAHIAVGGAFVAQVGFFQAGRFDLVEGIEAAQDEPLLIIAAVG